MGFWLFQNRLFHSFLKSFLDLLIIGPNGFRPVEMSIFRRGTSGSENRAQIHAVLVTETWFEKALRGQPYPVAACAKLSMYGADESYGSRKARNLVINGWSRTMEPAVFFHPWILLLQFGEQKPMIHGREVLSMTDGHELNQSDIHGKSAGQLRQLRPVIFPKI